MPAEARAYAASLRKTYDEALAAEKAAQPRHLDDCLEFASRAWRRPLTAKEKLDLRAFYQKMLAVEPDHTRAIKALIARILVAPEFLYKLEMAMQGPVRWSDLLRRAAGARPRSITGKSPAA